MAMCTKVTPARAYFIFISVMGIGAAALDDRTHTRGNSYVEISPDHFSVHAVPEARTTSMLRREVLDADATLVQQESSSSSMTNTRNASTSNASKVFWGNYEFEVLPQTDDCIHNGEQSLFEVGWTGETTSGGTLLKMTHGTIQESGANTALLKSVSGGIRIHKEACPDDTALIVGGMMEIPASTTSIEVVFAILESPTGMGSPFMMALYDNSGTLRKRWCWNHQGPNDKVQCDENITVDENTWQRKDLNIESLITAADGGKLEVAVYTSGDFTHRTAMTPSVQGVGGKATAFVDTLVFKPNRPEPPDNNFMIDVTPICKDSYQSVCQKGEWCFEKYRCQSGTCVDGKARCNQHTNCASLDDSDEVGCHNWPGFRFELFAHHVPKLEDWITSCVSGGTTGASACSLFSTPPSERIMAQNPGTDVIATETDWWEKYGVRGEFAAVWRGTIKLTHSQAQAGLHKFKYGGPGFRRLIVEPRDGDPDPISSVSYCTAACADTSCSGCTCPNFEDNCLELTSAPGTYDLTLVYIHTTYGDPRMDFKWYGHSTFAQQVALMPKAELTGSQCRTFACASGFGLAKKPAHTSGWDRVCGSSPCTSDDNAICCSRQYKAISAGPYSTCALDVKGDPICWGADSSGLPTIAWKNHKGPYLDLDVRDTYTCGVKDTQAVIGENPSGQLDCWRHRDDDASAIFTGTQWEQDSFTNVSVGSDHVCALRPSTIASCLGPHHDADYEAINQVTLKRVVAGKGFTCGIKDATGVDANGVVECWGSITRYVTPSTGLKFKTLEAGENHACGILENNTVKCWGENTDAKASDPTGADFLKVAPGGSHTCAIKTDHTAHCWGANAANQADPPTGMLFIDIAAGAYHSCGVRKDNQEVACWGSNFVDVAGSSVFAGQAEPPLANIHFLINNGV